jgi:D-alanyl-D-alanine dipeptidase
MMRFFSSMAIVALFGMCLCGLGVFGMPGAVAADAGKAVTAVLRLPSGFVRLEDLAPGVVIDMRYATARNFTGDVVPGYRANSCILAKPVAQALARVQSHVRAQGYGLKVYDCYRPHRSVQAFVRWASGGAGGKATKYYYPRIARQRIIPLGYIAERSSHSFGTAVDLTLVRLTGNELPKTGSAPVADQAAQSADSKRSQEAGSSCIITPAPRPAADGGQTGNDRAGTGSEIDMGTRWDCFDVMSHTRNSSISELAQANRKRLLQAMSAEGFRNYSREWWHFSMSMKAYRRGHDFVVE